MSIESCVRRLRDVAGTLHCIRLSSSYAVVGLAVHKCMQVVVVVIRIGDGPRWQLWQNPMHKSSLGGRDALLAQPLRPHTHVHISARRPISRSAAKGGFLGAGAATQPGPVCLPSPRFRRSVVGCLCASLTEGHAIYASAMRAA